MLFSFELKLQISLYRKSSRERALYEPYRYERRSDRNQKRIPGKIAGQVGTEQCVPGNHRFTGFFADRQYRCFPEKIAIQPYRI
jgi:hypothetical protein